MNILLATLCLNEMEWLPALYEQHRDWPGVTNWVFVEAVDRVYANTNPQMVTQKGLSVDGTSNYLQKLASRNSGVIYIPHGFTEHEKPDQGKCAARQRYLKVAEAVEPDFIFVIDADEFYTREDQKRIQVLMETANPEHTAFCFPHTHPWRPPSISYKSLFGLGVYGGFWDIGFVRGWRWQSGCCYRANHNHIETSEGGNLKEDADGNDAMLDYRGCSYKECPTCVHMGFTASLGTRKPKHLYYAARGEGHGDGRGLHVKSREAFETWQPGVALPGGANVRDYKGPIPECFR